MSEPNERERGIARRWRPSNPISDMLADYREELLQEFTALAADLEQRARLRETHADAYYSRSDAAEEIVEVITKLREGKSCR